MQTKRIILLAAILSGFAVSTGALADAESNTLQNNWFQQSVSNTNCANFPSGSCTVSFPPTTNPITVVTAVSCIGYASVGSFAGFLLGHQEATFNQSLYGEEFHLQGFVYGNLGSYLQIGLNASTNMYMLKGDYAVIQMDLSNGGVTMPGNFMCTITGYHS